MAISTLPAPVQSTWAAIEGRLGHRPVAEVVPEGAMALLDAVVQKTSDIAFERWPTNTTEDRAYRAHFWKLQLLQQLANSGRKAEAGLYACYLHEYVAATLRGDEIVQPDDVLEIPHVPHYGGHLRAARDAYIACSCSLR